MIYLDFARRNVRPLAFGFTHVFYSAPGQTYVIGLFVAALAMALGISPTAVAALYLAATLTSAATLILVGHWIDHIRLVHFSGVVVLGLAVACFTLAAVNSPFLLFVAFYLLRLSGQGLMMHVDGTATARTFDRERGRALAITALGAPVSEIVFPPLAIIGIEAIGWRASYIVMGAVALLVVFPFTQWLLRTFKRAPPGMTKPEGEGRKLVEGLALLVRSRTVRQILPSLTIFPFAGTAIMFHVRTIAEAQGWSTPALAAAFPALAVAAVVGLLTSGSIIDRYTALRVYPFGFLPMIAGMAVIAAFPTSSAALIGFGLIGLGGGMARTTHAAIWPELFGVESLGTIRSGFAMFMVFCSGLSPLVFGLALDLGASVASALWGLAVYSAVSLIPALLLGPGDAEVRSA